jgi:hypothetical protein
MAKLILKNEVTDSKTFKKFQEFHSWYKKIGGEIPLKNTESVIDRFKKL